MLRASSFLDARHQLFHVLHFRPGRDQPRWVCDATSVPWLAVRRPRFPQRTNPVRVCPGAIAEFTALTEQINTNTSSISKRAFMDHEGLAGLLADLRGKAGAAAGWVAAKPHEHAGHHR